MQIDKEQNMSGLKYFFTDETGATAIEYGLIAALIAVAIIVSAGSLGTHLSTKFSAIATNVSSAS